MGKEKSTKVLIVDDDVTLREMYAERLKIEGYNVLIAQNGDDGIIQAKKFSPDVILLDIMMPGTNGFGVLESLQKNSETTKIPVLMLTALMQEDNKKKSEKAGAIGYIIKSETTPAEVLEKIKEVIA